ncbi:MFS transporter [Thermosynechococcus sp. B3]|uniref:MFS transporter n=1 Tax=unclassified Thermosynechococcus TaxID=2622553 RepID=UPI0025753D97|nr:MULTISPECIES: MFS transporter [unclassified Thermosynechococcus]WJI26764.1 MFS transporter [Thermosynechococcus sp. B1]WJI29296.1 MFS transporter [Thermosynechococcus sp. B3]WKT83875.1 MFS transporter [Thermosynechococcus sp. HY596]WNC63006.1 MFS transporter [Thermosynechococcus sp. HY591]WNC65566.1 MFS transporter [Thermosynechococcus sp. HY593]
MVCQKGSALRFVVLLGVVSLCADATYEGARSLTGVYLGVLGASGTVVGLVAGLGEFIGYGLRLGIGYLSDRTRAYWRITTLGYAINTLAVPLMALAHRWEVLAGLMIAERTGKAIRTPPRDVLLSYGARQVGRGFGFGLHEAMDQIGAVVGPLMVAGVFALTRHYQWSFAVLAIPALMGLVVLLVTQWRYPEPRDFETVVQDLDTKRLPTLFWIYLLAMAFLGAGYVDFPLIAFHLQQGDSLQTSQIPLLYALAMGVDAVAALLFGYLLDRIGIMALILAVVLSVGFAPLVFLSSAVIWGMVLWGIGMGAQESIVRAIVANLVPPERRGSAYGIFSTGYGLAWFLGSLLMGVLYDRSLGLLVLVSVVLQLLGLPLLLWIRQGARHPA